MKILFIIFLSSTIFAGCVSDPVINEPTGRVTVTRESATAPARGIVPRSIDDDRRTDPVTTTVIHDHRTGTTTTVHDHRTGM